MKQESLSLSLVKLIFVATIITSIGLVLIIGATGYFLSKPKIEPVVVQPTSQPSEEIVKEDTLDWKTYINPGFKYSVKYPQDWEIKTSKDFKIITLKESNSNDTITIGKQEGSPNTSLEENADYLKNSLEENKYTFRELDEIEISGGEVFLDLSTPDFVKQVYLVNKSGIFTVIYHYYKYSEETELEKEKFLLEKFIPNFKFNDELPSEIYDVANWKTYRNEEYGFEFKYAEEQLIYPPLEIYEEQFRFNNIVYPKIRFGEFGNGCYIVIVKTDRDSTINPFDESNVSVKQMQYAFSKKLDSGYAFYHVGMAVVSHAVNPDECKPMFNQILSTFKFIEKEEMVNWSNYKFELEDITKAEDFIIDPKTRSLLNIPFDTRIWKVNIETGEKEIFIASTKKAAGKPLMNILLPEFNAYKGKIHQINDKLFLIPYDPGSDRPSSEIWQLDTNNKEFKKLSISKFLGNFGMNEWSLDHKRIINTEEEENNQVLRVLDILEDSFRIIATTSGDKAFAISAGLCSFGSVEWIDNNKIKYRIYNTKKGLDLCTDEKPEVLEEKIIEIK